MKKMRRIYHTDIFSDIYPTLESFMEDREFYDDIKVCTDAEAKVLYLLLMGKYANTPIFTQNNTQFKVRLFTTIYEYAPIYFKKRALQDAVKVVTEEEASKGTRAVYNQANNPNSEPSSSALEELEYINQQNTTGYKFSKLETYERMYAALKGDTTEEFLQKFIKLFALSLYPARPVLYFDFDDGESEDE
jgi:hypothetical protein